MPLMSAAQAAQKWRDNLRTKWSAIQAGVNRVTRAPGELAAAKEDVWYTKLTAAYNSHKWRDRVAGVTLEQWKASFPDVLGPAFIASVDSTQPEMTTFYSQLLPFIQSGLDTIDSSVGPHDGTLLQAAARAAWWVQYMGGFTRT